MDERDQAALGTDAWGFIDKTHSFGLELCERCLDVVNLYSDMMNAAAALLQESADRRILRRRFKQLHATLADGKHRNTYFLVLNDLCVDVFEPQSVFPELESFV